MPITRLICAFFTGALLTQIGSIGQVMTNNKLSGPSTLGIDGVAVLVNLILFYGFASSSTLSIELVSLILIFIVLTILGIRLFKESKVVSNSLKSSSQNLIMIGIALNLMVGSLFYLFYYLSMIKGESFPSQLWFGDFRNHSVSASIVLTVIFVFNSILIYKTKFHWIFLLLGEDFARAQGLRIKSFYFLNISIMFFALIYIVSQFGVFSFLGIVIPHILRQLSFFRSSILSELLKGPVLGGLFLGLVDYICYSLPFHGAEIPVGMLSGIIGSICLVALLVKSKA